MHTYFKWNVRDVSIETNRSFVKKKVEEKENVSSMSLTQFFSCWTDLECVFTIICNLVTKAGSPDESLEMAKLISAKICQQPNDKPALRLKM